jgi:hypothetical protein
LVVTRDATRDPRAPCARGDRRRRGLAPLVAFSADLRARPAHQEIEVDAFVGL